MPLPPDETLVNAMVRYLCSLGWTVLEPGTVLSNSDDDELIGGGVAARILGVSKQRVRQLIRAGRFPPPARVIDAHPYWHRTDIENYAKFRTQQPGPKPAKGDSHG